MSLLKLSVVAHNATISMVPDKTSVTEGEQVTITISTTGYQYKQPIPYTIEGTGITVADFVGLTSLNNTVEIGRDGTAQIVLTLSDDETAEGDETFDVVLFNGMRLSFSAIDGTDPWEIWSGQSTNNVVSVATSVQRIEYPFDVTSPTTWSTWNGTSTNNAVSVATSVQRIEYPFDVTSPTTWSTWNGTSTNNAVSVAGSMIEIQQP